MLQMTGKVVNVFVQAGGTDKDGKQYEARSKVQLLGEMTLKDGEVKNELVDLTIDDANEWQSLMGKDVIIDVGSYAPAKNTIYYSVKQGSKPRLKQGAFGSPKQQ